MYSSEACTIKFYLRFQLTDNCKSFEDVLAPDAYCHEQFIALMKKAYRILARRQRSRFLEATMIMNLYEEVSDLECTLRWSYLYKVWYIGDIYILERRW